MTTRTACWCPKSTQTSIFRLNKAAKQCSHGWSLALLQLQDLEASSNTLTGTLPSEWGSLAQACTATNCMYSCDHVCPAVLHLGLTVVCKYLQWLCCVSHGYCVSQSLVTVYACVPHRYTCVGMCVVVSAREGW